MNRCNRPLLFALAFACGQASGHGRDDYEGLAIQSLSTPDPIFVSSDNVAIRVTADKSSALRKARVLLNGHDVPSAFAAVSDEEMTGQLMTHLVRFPSASSHDCSRFPIDLRS